MISILKKSLNFIDCLIIILAVFIFAKMDYSDLSLLNKIYLASFGLWSVMLGVRIYIVYKNGGGKND
ncbi:MAG: hypothetical protein J5809_07280 [Selenomonadaceae bacterium]|nr:hypothetical protein [Selenomonadaceae bacterium]